MERTTINFYKPQLCSELIDNNTGAVLSAPASIAPGVYRHYKGKFYVVFFVTLHSETLKETVVYQALYGDFLLWSRPLAMFTEEIEYQGVVQPRFVWVDEPESMQRYS